ncbi:MAG: hypothetical protein AB1792_08135 [Candidatus Zixiibacteriota bacterium]
MGAANGARANLVLLFLVGLLAGGIGGFFIGRQEVGGVAATQTAVTPTVLNDVIPVEDAWIVAGFSCPMPGCTNPLLNCPGELPRRIRDWVNSQLAAGRPGADIRAEIERVHGANLHKLPGGVVDTTHKGT